MAWGGYGRSGGFWRPYVPVWKRRQQAAKKAKDLAKKGREVEPIEIEGRTIARTFWGQSWCENLEHYSDFENRLPRGRTYVRNGSVIDLQVEAGRVKALVSGSEIYSVTVKLAALAKKRWASIKEACSGKIDTVVELLEGKLSRAVMEILTARETGLFPSPKEIEMECSCPDWATMCKHVAAVLYGVGARLDSRPDLLFVLRGVDGADLARRAVAGAARLGAAGGEAMDAGEIEKVFGIEIDAEAPARDGAAGHSRPVAAASGFGTDGSRRRGRARGDGGRRAGGDRGRPTAVGPSRRAETADRSREGRGTASRRNGSLAVRIPDLLRHFRKAESLTNSEYRRLFSVEPLVATRELGELADQGILLRTGKKRGTRYLPGHHMQ
jgi:uncharacterized Zn finger protein